MSENGHCGTLAQFMWWAARSGTSTEDYRIKITLLADPKPSVAKWRDLAISEALTRVRQPDTSQANQTGISEALVGTLGALKETMESIQLKEPADQNKTFKYLPVHSKKMLYRLSHVPGDPEPTSLTETGKVFMAQTTITNATSLLNSALNQVYGISAVVQPGSVQALRVGNLLWDDATKPGNHSIFQYYPGTPGDSPDSTTALAWHLTSTEGRGIEGSEIQKALKLAPRVAQSVFGASRQILNFGCVHGYLFGETCPIYEGLNSFAAWMLSPQAMSILEMLATKHDRFYERLLASIDVRVQAYIFECSKVQSHVDDIDASLLNFMPLRKHLQIQIVSDLVGPVFHVSRGGKNPREDENNYDDENNPSTKSRTIQNENPHPTIALTTSQDWNKVRKFCALLPFMDGVRICGRYHCRQSCNSKCPLYHGRLNHELLAKVVAWITASKAKTRRGGGRPAA